MSKFHVTAGGSRVIKMSDDKCRILITECSKELEAIDCKITYEALTKEIADVDEKGLVTPKKPGEAKFRVTIQVNDEFHKIEAVFPVVIGKTKPSLMTEEKRLIARENIEKYDWAARKAKKEIDLADYYLKFRDQLWDLVPGEGIPRCLTVGTEGDPKGYYCRYCGEDLRAGYGNYPWITNALEDPWKVQCPACKRRFPSNDFGGYYRLGLNEYGIFDPVIAKRKNDELIASGHKGYLVNELYPEMGEGWGVDDGFGYIPRDKDGNPHIYNNGIMERHTYIGYYMHWGIWTKALPFGGAVMEAVKSLGYAYAYTQNPEYGRAGAILLDRIADVYPDFHYLLGDEYHGRGWKGKTIDSIWETGVARTLAESYDNLYPAFDDPFVVDFLREKSKHVKMSHTKENATQIRNNIEDGVLRASFEAAVSGELLGNFGYHQSAVAAMAVVLDTLPESEQWIQWIMADGDRNAPITGGNVIRTLVDIVDRDGMGNEASGYNVGWINSMMKVADVLEGYDKVPMADLYGNVKFKNMFSSLAPVIAGGFYSPQIGDSGSTAGTGLWMSAEVALKGFQKYGDKRFAQLAFLLNGNTSEGLRLGITDKDPTDIRRKIDEVIAEEGSLCLSSEMMTGFGFSILRENHSEKQTGNQDFWIYFGKNGGHGHRDTLNLGVSAFDLNMAPDLGYPEKTAAQPNRLQWVCQTLSHNTVLVDGSTQNAPFDNGNGGYPLHFDDSDLVKLFDIDAPNQFKNTKIYRRTLVMVKTDDQSYGVDFFRILGGDSHLYSFHSQSDEIVETTGLELIPQTDEEGNFIGSYAGASVPYGPDPYSPESWHYETIYPRGYTWTHSVSRDQKRPKSFSVDFKVKDFNKVLKDSEGLHLRMTMLSDVAFDEVTTVKGHTPKKEPNKNVPDLSYVFVKREGEDLDTLFTTVYEPYKNSSTIQSVESEKLVLIDGSSKPEDTAKAVKVTLKNGRIDTVVYSTNPSLTYRVADLFDFRGFAGVYSVLDGNVQFKYIQDGDILEGKVADHGAVTGTVKDFTKKLTTGNEIIISPDQDVDQEILSGRFVFVDNDKKENGAYLIKRAEKLSDGSVSLDIGDVSLVRRFLNNKKDEYEYNIREGQGFRIPLSYIKKQSLC